MVRPLRPETYCVDREKAESERCFASSGLPKTFSLPAIRLNDAALVRPSGKRS